MCPYNKPTAYGRIPMRPYESPWEARPRMDGSRASSRGGSRTAQEGRITMCPYNKPTAPRAHPDAPLREIRIGRPLQWVGANIFPDLIQFILVADDVIVKIPLPQRVGWRTP